MAGRWILSWVELRGYAGVGQQPLRVDFDRPLVVLEGPNGSGKSTIVSGIEWALFGELALGGDFELAELKGGGTGPYLVYLNKDCAEAEVLVGFERAGSSLEWRRLRTRAKPRNDVVECLVDGRPTPADPVAVFGVTRELYTRAVAPQQGSLAAIVSLESKERDAALDRLFGIEELNVLAEGLSKAKGELARTVKLLEGRLTQAETDLRDEVKRRFDTRADFRSRAIAAGLKQAELTLEEARSRAASLSAGLSVRAPAPNATLSDMRSVHRKLVPAADTAWSHQVRPLAGDA